jgi:hypothetical protein
MPGLLRGVARTAVVAGTATAVSGRVQRRQAEKYATRDANIYAQEQQAYDAQMAQQQPVYQQPAAPPPAPAPAPAAEPDMVGELQRLGDLKAQGLLTDEEFQAAKAKILGI